MQIHISRNGQQFGPYSLDDVRAQLASGAILPTDLAWKEGAPDWQPLSSMPEFAGIVPPVQTAKTSGLAIASLVLGILSLVLCWIGGVAAIPAVICGHLSLSKIKKSAGTLSGQGMAIAGLVMGYISIVIMVIAGPLIFAGRNGQMIAGSKVQAKNDMGQIVNAIQLYYTEYGRYPAVSGTTNADATYGLTEAKGNEQIINILRCPSAWCATDTASTKPQNPRQIKFLSVADAKNQSNPRSGILTTTGAWYDPWGHQYIIRIDSGYTGKVTTPDGQQISCGVIAWSLGPDGKKIIASWE